MSTFVKIWQNMWKIQAAFVYTTVSKCTTVLLYTQRWSLYNESQRKSTKTDENRQGIGSEPKNEIPTAIQRNLKFARFYNFIQFPSRLQGSGERNCKLCNLLVDHLFAIVYGTVCKHGSAFCLMQVYITVGPCNIYPPTEISSMAYPSGHRRHRRTAYTHRV